ncbi:MAG: TetR/AcrR family transcriptional regulator [Terricaulis sp.]|nr:TetR/AcrR family transcriptional regulator [Terricaulis sp.]
MADEEDDKEGRPQDRGQARREAFLAAAREVFLRRGYRAASVNEVVRIAGGSLATLYQQFGNKEGLFHAFVLDQHARFTADMAPESVDHLELEDGLRAIGVRYLSNLLKPDTLAFYRLVVSEGMQFPEDARRDVERGGRRRAQARQRFSAGAWRPGRRKRPPSRHAARALAQPLSYARHH